MDAQDFWSRVTAVIDSLKTNGNGPSDNTGVEFAINDIEYIISDWQDEEHATSL